MVTSCNKKLPNPTALVLEQYMFGNFLKDKHVHLSTL